MSFSSIREMLQASQTARQPLYEVILESDLAESGLTRAESEAPYQFKDYYYHSLRTGGCCRRCGHYSSCD